MNCKNNKYSIYLEIYDLLEKIKNLQDTKLIVKVLEFINYYVNTLEIDLGVNLNELNFKDKRTANKILIDEFGDRVDIDHKSKNEIEKHSDDIKQRILDYLQEEWKLKFNPNIIKVLNDFGVYGLANISSFFDKLVDLHKSFYVDYIIEKNCLRLVEYNLVSELLPPPKPDLMLKALKRYNVDENDFII